MPETTSLTRSFEAKIDDVSTHRRTVTAKINTNCVDRYNTVIVPKGGDWSNFMRSGPAVLWEHGNDPNRGRLPVAHCNSLKYRKMDDDILGVVQFKGDDFSSQVMEMYADGTLRSFSVEFLPDAAKSGRPTQEEVRANPSWGGAHTIYRSWELTGFSAVSYPGNPEALALAVERGLWVPEETRQAIVEKKQAEPTEDTPQAVLDLSTVREMIRAEFQPFAELFRAMGEGNGSQGGYTTKTKDSNDDDDDDDDDDEYARYITHEDGQFVVHAEDGKVLGKHKTKADAVAQLQAIEISKHKKSLPESREEDREAPLPVVKTFTLQEMNHRIVESMLPMFRTMYFASQAKMARDLDDLARGKV